MTIQPTQGLFRAVFALFVATLLGFQLGAAPAKSATGDASPASKSASTVRISFRANNIAKKTALHLHSATEADQIEKTLKQLGCVTTRSQHDGHIDLAYECKFWRSLNLKDQTEAEKWNAWLTKHKFSVVENNPPKTRKETVQYQLKDWRAYHPRNELEGKLYTELFKMLGCEVSTAKHGNHEDIRYRCPSWQTIGVPSHAIAHAWMAQLKKLGFATMHEH